MNFILHPWLLFFVVFCGWVNERQTEIIEFQNAQIDAQLKKLGKTRMLLTDDQRQILAVKGKARGRRTLRQLTTRERRLSNVRHDGCGLNWKLAVDCYWNDDSASRIGRDLPLSNYSSGCSA